MPRFPHSARYRATALLAGALVLAALFLAIDLQLPLGVSGGLFYMALVGLGWFFPGPRYIVGLGLLSSVLILAGWLFSPDGGTPWVVSINRLLAIFAVWSVVCILVIAKRSEAAVRASETRRIDLLYHASEAVICLDASQCIRAFNKGAEEIFGYPAAEVVGEPLDVLLPVRFRGLHRDQVEKFVRSPDSVRLMGQRMAVTGLRKDGQEFPAIAAICKHGPRQDALFTVVLQGINSEASSEEKTAKLAEIPAQNPDPVLRVAKTGRVLYANMAARAASDFFSPQDPDSVCENLQAKIADAARFEDPKDVEIASDGRTFLLTLTPIAGESYLNIYGRDITERVQAEAALRERVTELENDQLILEHQGANLIHLADDLKDAREQAETASRAKSQFLAAVSHELRTPLNAILGFAEIIKGEMIGPVGSERYLSYARDIYQSGDHLLSLINDILDISKVEAGNMELCEEQIDLADLINGVVRLVRQRAKENGIKLTLEIRDDLPILMADERKLKQVLMNLLSNAIKFTEPGGTVTLKSWHQIDSGFVFQVLDDGIGMAPQDIPKALSQFGQIDSDLNRKYDGTGLGLPLSKSLVEMHGGSLDLQSQLGVGTTATVRLPAARMVPVETIQAAAG